MRDGAGRALCWRLTTLQGRGHESRTCPARLSQPGWGAPGHQSWHKSYYLLSTSNKIHLPNFLCPSTCTISLKNALCLGCTTYVLQKGSNSTLYLPVGLWSTLHKDCSYNTLQHKMLCRCWKKGGRWEKQHYFICFTFSMLFYFSSNSHFCLQPGHKGHYTPQCHYHGLFFSLCTVPPAFMSLYWYIYSFELLQVFTLLCKQAARINTNFQGLHPSDRLTTRSH